jgi:hypothetical protein
MPMSPIADAATKGECRLLLRRANPDFPHAVFQKKSGILTILIGPILH